ncbi:MULTISPECIES: hypothetical protein [unclassified Nocardioides]|uniref:hypothetical protein n=1 Tax=unclassified Nocardioides TaxID=2615069 RepID=UPI0006FAF192|nr:MULTISPECIES: hypothetical protein [unclassified Nocardioides]KQY62650.1 hypothetical protein ASD30_23335 [Nocardioides sp. Root140]KRF15021.1 hypothetical protein ASH02_12300 [Nocardioides sp. Soil796]
MSEADVADTVAMTVHGPSGAVDLVVPNAASAGDVAREYAVQCGLQHAPALFTTTGTALAPTTPIALAGLRSGAMLVALDGPLPTGPTTRHPSPVDDSSLATPGRSVLPVLLATLAAGLAGLLAAHTESDGLREATLVLLAATAAVGVLPLGRFVDQRAVAAPAFGAAAAWVPAWDPSPSTLPLTFGIAGLGAAVTAAVGCAGGAGPAVVQQVWIASGVGVFAVSGSCVLAGFDPQVAWAALLVVALLATRSVAGLAVNVPDQVLLDLDRLAVSAWSARDKALAGRGSLMIKQPAVVAILARGARVVDASAAAILVVTVFAAPNLLRSATYDVDRPGARCLVLFAGAGLLLAARSFRHPRARGLLRCAGLFAWAVLVLDVATTLSHRSLLYVALACLVLGLGTLLAAVATGRGWRSARWARRAEWAETVVGVLAIGSLVVASGLVRIVWEIPFTR